MIALRLADVFVPDGDEARRRAQEELGKGEYEAAKPTWFDHAVSDLLEGIARLFRGDSDQAVAPISLTVIVVIVVAALVVALLVWGRPRATRATRRRSELLGERDDRTAAQLRKEAAAAAEAGDWDRAVVLRYRALARALIDRDVIDPAPGATAQGIARSATTAFPAFADRLHAAATAFDAVRYLGIPATAQEYQAVADTDAELDATSPAAPAFPAVHG